MEGFPRQNARTRRFSCGNPRTVSLSSNGSRVLFLRSLSGSDPVNALWQFDPLTGTERLVVDPFALLGDEGKDSAQERKRRERVREIAEGIVAYDGVADLSTACFALAGRIFVVEVDIGRITELPSSGDAYDPRLSPDGTLVSYISNGELRITGAEGDFPLLDELTSTSFWGSAEFVAAEEMGRTRGHWWAPNGEQLLVTKVDEQNVTEWWIAAPDEPWLAPRSIRYPSAGTDNADVSLYFVDLKGGLTQVHWNGNGEFEYLASVSWDKNEIPILLAQSRDQRTAVVLEADPRDGSVNEIYRVQGEDCIEIIPGAPCRWEGALVTVEDRNGARRLVVDGESISPDGLQIRSVVGVNLGKLVVCASADPLDVDIAAISFDGSMETLSRGGGVHSAVVGGGLMAISAETLSGSLLQVSGLSVRSYAEEPSVEPTPIFAIVGARDLRTALLLPKGHGDSTLPVLLDPYAGPHAQKVQRARSKFLTSQWFADQGFAVVVVDGRGTPGRGPEWERSVRGDLAQPVLEDQIDGLTALAETDPRLDMSRVAIRGWSFGGYLAALALSRRPDIFHAGIAGAPVTDWRLYDTHYTERYLGHPDLEAENYARSNLSVEKGSLTRPLLLIHGLADDNVLASHTFRFSRTLLEKGISHRVLPLLGATHVTSEEKVVENLLYLELGFLRESLKL